MFLDNNIAKIFCQKKTERFGSDVPYPKKTLQMQDLNHELLVSSIRTELHFS